MKAAPTALCLLLLLASPVRAADDDAVRLPDLRIEGDISGLLNWRARLRQQLDEQAPCLGCEDLPDRESLLGDLFGRFTPPEHPSAAEQLDLQHWRERNFSSNVHNLPISHELTVSRDVDAFERQRRILAGELGADALFDVDER